MKRILSLILLLAFAFIIISCTPPGSGGTTSGEDDTLSSTLTVASKDISSIAPYAYGSTTGSIAGKKSLNLNGRTYSYLSYMSPDSIGFQPLTFENTSGTKIVLESTRLYDIGANAYLAFIDNIQTVKEEPRVVYEQTGVDKETKEPIYEPVEIMIAVTNSLGQNYGIFDADKQELYLLRNPEAGGFFYIEENPDPNIMDELAIATQNTIYIVANTIGDSNILYSLNRNNPSAGLIPLTNTTTMKWPFLITASDNLALFYGTASGNHYDIVKGNSKEDTPVRLNLKNHIGEYYFGDDILAEGNHIYIFNYNKENSFQILKAEYTGNALTGETLIQQPYKTSGSWNNIKLMGVQFVANGTNGIFKVGSSDNRAMLMKVTVSNGNISTEEIMIPSSYNEIDDIAISGNRVYWVDGVLSENSSICYADFSTGSVHSRPIMGKTIASPKINVSENGIVTYWQHMSGSDIGTFCIDINKNEEPRLLMSSSVDVQQVINFNAL